MFWHFCKKYCTCIVQEHYIYHRSFLNTAIFFCYNWVLVHWNLAINNTRECMSWKSRSLQQNMGFYFPSPWLPYSFLCYCQSRSSIPHIYESIIWDLNALSKNMTLVSKTVLSHKWWWRDIHHIWDLHLDQYSLTIVKALWKSCSKR